MKKYAIFFALILLILLLAAFFGRMFFTEKKIFNIDIQDQDYGPSISEESTHANPVGNAKENIAETGDEPEEGIQKKNESEQGSTEENNPENKESEDNGGDGTKSELKITNKLLTWGFEKISEREIDTIILHSSYDALGKDPFSITGIIEEYREYGVSAHYLMGRGGETYRLVEDGNIAYHAGVSKMPDGRTGVNTFSIGIELVNTEEGKITKEQYSSLNILISDLKKKYPIKYVLGHSDIAPGRKTDPWGIEWDKVRK